jgi:hypothetical protein
MTDNNRSSGNDPIGDFQRWLMRSSAKNVSREIKGTFRRTFGGSQDNGDIWETATTEPPSAAGEAPECAWCPVCRAARRFRDSGPGLASHAAAAGDALMSVAQDTIAAFEATLSARPPGTGHKSPEGTGWPAEPPAREPSVSEPAVSETSVSETPVSEASVSESTVRPPAQPSGEGQKAPDDPDHRP